MYNGNNSNTKGNNNRRSDVTTWVQALFLASASTSLEVQIAANASNGHIKTSLVMQVNPAVQDVDGGVTTYSNTKGATITLPLVVVSELAMLLHRLEQQLTKGVQPTPGEIKIGSQRSIRLNVDGNTPVIILSDEKGEHMFSLKSSSNGVYASLRTLRVVLEGYVGSLASSSLANLKAYNRPQNHYQQPRHCNGGNTTAMEAAFNNAADFGDDEVDLT